MNPKNHPCSISTPAPLKIQFFPETITVAKTFVANFEESADKNNIRVGTIRKKSPPHSVILTHVLCTIQDEYLIDDVVHMLMPLSCKVGGFLIRLSEQ